jgi:AcrR family transcriptional regulator
LYTDRYSTMKPETKPRAARPGKRHITTVARRLFENEGIQASGMDRIAAECGVTKRTLYYHFPSKDDLIVAALLEPSPISLTLTDEPPARQLLSVFDNLARWFAEPTFRGCPYVNAVAETGEAHPARVAAITQKDRRFAYLLHLTTAAGASDPAALAMQIQLLFEGAVATTVVRRGTSFASVAKDAARRLMASYGVTLPKRKSRVSGPRRR